MTQASPPPQWFSPDSFDSAQEHELEVAGAQIRFRTSGDGEGPTLLFVHGGRAHAAWWAHIPPLLGARMRWAATDLTGHGDSDHRHAYDGHQWAEEVAAVAEQVDTGSGVVLVGHSLGSAVSILTAASRGFGDGSPLAAVVAIDGLPWAPGGRRPAVEPSLSPPWFDTIDDGVREFTSRSSRHGWPDWLARFTAERSLTTDELGRHVWKHDWRTRESGLPILDGTGLLEPEKMVLVLGGASPFSARNRASELYSTLEGRLPVTEIAGAGHDVMMEKPREFVDELLRRLESWGFGPR